MKYIPISILLLLSVLLFSCEDAIDLKLKDNTPKYVIEGIITNEQGFCEVNVSQTKNFGDDNQFNGVSDAIVKIENNGATTLLSETKKGVYVTDKINGIPGQTYHLTVITKEEAFTASSTMPDPVPFLDFTLKPADYDTLRTTPMIKFKDISGIKNYYWFQQFINDKIQRQYKVFNDEFTAGQEVNDYLVFENTTKDRNKNIVKGDKLTAEMHCVDAAVYTYMFSLYNANGSSDGAAPANPVTNIKGGALGFFSAHTVQRKTIVIP